MPVLSTPAVFALATSQWGVTTKRIELSPDQPFGTVAFPYLLADIMTEIAWLESGFQTNALGTNFREKGLWQIHPQHVPALIADGIILRESDLWKPGVNVRAAKWVYDKQGLDAWTTAETAMRNIVEGKAHRQQAVAVDLPPQADIGFGIDPINLPQAPDITGWTQAIGNFFSILADPEFWKRVGLGALAAGIIIVSVVVYNQQTIKDLK